VFLYGGWVFLQGAYRELADRLPGMMTLIALAISVAFIYSVAVTLGFEGHALWWELATLVTIMLLGHWIEMRSIFQAQGALKELAKLLPDMARASWTDDRPRRSRSTSCARATCSSCAPERRPGRRRGAEGKSASTRP
jgi:P-type Cu2+ transporter